MTRYAEADCSPRDYAAAMSVFRYDEVTGGLTRVLSHGRPHTPRAVGYPDRCGYLRCWFFGKSVYVHRIIWLLHTGAWPANEIDHINGDVTDNRASNLRDVSHSVNLHNRSGCTVRSASGVVGVTLCKKTSRWRADIRVNGKCFNLGRFDSLADAKSAYALGKIRFGVEAP